MSKKEKTKQKIIDAFWSLYETTRIEKITVKDICIKANINRSTFYEYFSDVYLVLETIEDSLIPNQTNLPNFELLHQGKSFDIETQLAYFKRNKKYLKVLLSENGNPAFRFKVINTIKPIVLSMLSDKEKPENFEYILEYVLWGMIGIMAYHINNENITDEESVLNTIIKISEKILDFKQIISND